MSTSNMLQTKEILNYKRFDSDTSLSDVEIPETAQNRRKTDTLFLYIFIGLIVLLIPSIIYALYYSDIRRINGYDKCGNVCGAKNYKYDEWTCTGEDMTDKPIFSDGNCAPAAPKDNSENNIEERDFDDRMITRIDDDPRADEYIKNAFMYLGKVGWKIALSSFISLGYCVIMVILFKHATAVLVWGILILTWTCLLVFTLMLWILIVDFDNGDGLAPAIISTALALVLLCIMIFLKKSIRLVIMLYKESAKAVFDMTLIFSVPAVTTFGMITITVVCLILTNYLCTSGVLTLINDGVLDYIPNTWMKVTIFLNLAMAYWAIQFISGIHYMVISGAVSKWYFTKNKELLGNPILTSALIALKFHLGSVALGSLIISLVALLRATLRALDKNHRLRLVIERCMSHLEAFLKFFTKNSFIMTAMHGTPFFQSGRQVVKLVTLNVCNTITINYIGDFVFGMAQVLIICLSLLTTYGLLLGENNDDYWYFCYLTVFAFTLICSSNILGTFEAAVDTLFLCFCEDCLMNDGVNKPYAMPRGLMEFAEHSKQVFAKKIQAKGLPTI